MKEKINRDIVIKDKQVLVVEDDFQIAEILRLYLENAGYLVDIIVTGKRALEKARAIPYDLIILDIMLPEMNGWDLCVALRKFSKVPVIMITARGSEEEVIKGLELGADDYLIKPFSPKELLARINAVNRRLGIGTSQNNTFLKAGNLEIWPEKRVAYCRGEELILTPKEFNLLLFFLLNQDRVFKREQILMEVWGYQYCDIRTVDTHVKQLREKIRYYCKQFAYISTVWGVGYKFEVKKADD